MIDIGKETILTLGQAAERLPRRRQGKKTSTSTIWRWAEYGVRGVRLETIDVGASRCTSVEALQKFFEAVTAARQGGSSPDGRQPEGRGRTDRGRREAIEKAGEQLDHLIRNPPKRRKKAAATKARPVVKGA
jgi:hypothetical protein